MSGTAQQRGDHHQDAGNVPWQNGHVRLMTSVSHQHVLAWCQYTPNIKQKNIKIFNKDNEASQLSFFFEMLPFLIFLMSNPQLDSSCFAPHLVVSEGGVLRRCRQMQVATECLWIKNPCRVSDDFGDFQHEFVLVVVVCFYLISHYRRAILSHLALFNRIFVDVTSAKNPWIHLLLIFPSPGSEAGFVAFGSPSWCL